jgi:hypothetical protein
MLDCEARVVKVRLLAPLLSGRFSPPFPLTSTESPTNPLPTTHHPLNAPFLWPDSDSSHRLNFQLYYVVTAKDRYRTLTSGSFGAPAFDNT